MVLNNESLQNKEFWEAAGYRLPKYDRAAMIEKTVANPTWLHFGAGNIFKAFQADACQRLLDAGLAETGIIAAERREKKPEANDNLTIKITLRANGSVEKAVVGSIAEKVYLYGNEARLKEIFENPSLQMVSFTITEKGYALYDAHGEFLPDIAADLAGSPETAKSYMGKLTALLCARYLKNKAPLAMVSMDNCSHNGDKLKAAITCFAEKWGGEGFNAWLKESVSFPWSMIDKITPGPDASVAAMLAADGLDAGTPFVNAEESEYLVIEDDFPNGRPCLEKAGIYFTARETVDKVERMKVCTCLNPLHTSLAVYGCLLGFDKIWQEMKDPDLKQLVETIGYKEGLPVVTDPGIIKPKDFIDAVLKVRIPNPFMPDMPQRIATDTSQKLPIRFGETIKAYMASDELDVNDLKLIPLVHAGWLRYLMAVDDKGEAFEPSPDPLLETAQAYVKDVKLGEKPDFSKIKELLKNTTIFGVDLVDAGLADKICGYFEELTAGPGAVRRTLHKYVTEEKNMKAMNEKISSIGVVPVIKLNNPERDAAGLAKALCAGDVPVAEVTFRAAGADKAIKIMKETCPEMLVGAGTVTNTAQIDAVIEAGGDFIVSPGFDPELVAYAQKKNIAIYPGCTTASEYHQALKFGLELIKFFPAEQSGGLAKIKALSAPFPMFKVMPTGGISLKNLKEYLSAPVIAACGGSYMVTADQIDNNKWDEITELCKKSREIVKEVRG